MLRADEISARVLSPDVTCRADDHVEVLVGTIDQLDSSRCDVFDVGRNKVNLCTADVVDKRPLIRSNSIFTLSSQRASRYPGPDVSLLHATPNWGITEFICQR